MREETGKKQGRTRAVAKMKVKKGKALLKMETPKTGESREKKEKEGEWDSVSKWQ